MKGKPSSGLPNLRPRRAAKQETILDSLRQEIARGKFKPGSRLPKQLEFARRFKMSVLTVQRAMDRLAHEGFIETRYSRGTFVVDHPPHLHHYALIFHADPSDLEPGGWSHFHAALANEAAKIHHAEKRQLECVYGIFEPTELPQYQRLVARVKSHQFAGLIFASHPGRLSGTPLVELAGVPRVGLMRYDPAFPQISAVKFDALAWFEKAFDYLAARGRKRIAFVSKPGQKLLTDLDCPPSLLSVRGLITHPYWNLPLPLWSAGAQHIVRLLMRSEGERPDALVITDDNAVEPAMAGLMAAGCRVPDDVEVVAHANFPRSGPGVLPLKWLGYDQREILQTAIAIIDQQCRGEKPPVATTIAPVFEEELATCKSAAPVMVH